MLFANIQPSCLTDSLDVTLIERRLKKDFSVFEYGSGYATLFYARFVKKVTSVEHNDGWYNQLKKSFPASVTHRRSRKTR